VNKKTKNKLLSFIVSFLMRWPPWRCRFPNCGVRLERIGLGQIFELKEFSGSLVEQFFFLREGKILAVDDVLHRVREVQSSDNSRKRT